MTKSEIAEAEGISAGYVQQLMMSLRLSGLIESHRGREGGFSLSRPADDITVAEVLKAVEGDVMPAPCLAGAHCDRETDCPTRPVWEEAAEMLNDLFGRTTIAQLAEKHAQDIG
jgi:Rrf2 family transcriptional regulator, cysteine metabolism repressor